MNSIESSLIIINTTWSHSKTKLIAFFSSKQMRLIRKETTKSSKSKQNSKKSRSWELTIQLQVAHTKQITSKEDSDLVKARARMTTIPWNNMSKEVLNMKNKSEKLTKRNNSTEIKYAHQKTISEPSVTHQPTSNFETNVLII